MIELTGFPPLFAYATLLRAGVKPRGLSLISDAPGQEFKLKPRRLERKVRPERDTELQLRALLRSMISHCVVLNRVRRVRRHLCGGAPIPLRAGAVRSSRIG